MAAAERRRRPVRTAEYVYGNTARQLAPERQPKKQARPRQRRSASVRRNQDLALQMNLPFVFLLMVAAVCTLYICVSYLQLQSSNAARLRNIESLERQIETLRADNDALETRINTSTDLDYIFRVATEELGMVYANKDQVRLYNKTESEYVRQYEDVPEW